MIRVHSSLLTPKLELSEPPHGLHAPAERAWCGSLHLGPGAQPCLLLCALSCFSPVQLFATLWTIAHQAPLSMGFSRQECWSG